MSLESKPTPLVAVALGTALVLVTYVTPIVSVPLTALDLDAGAGTRAWILSSMSVGLAAALLVSGVIGDTVGRRRVYDVGLVLLAAGAVVCAVAWAPWVVVAGRAVQGVGGAAILACGLSLLAVHFAPGPARVHATSVWGASVGVGIALGSVLTAAIGEVGTGWRETYAVTAVLALALLPLGRAVPESRAERPRPVDVPGLVLLVVGMTLLVSAVTEVRNGFGVLTGLLLIGAVVVLVAYGLVERRVAAPLVEPALLLRPGFLAATLGSLTLGLSMIGVASFVPTVLQTGLGRGLWTASLVPAVWAAASVVTSLLLRRLPFPVAGPRAIAVVLVLVAAGQSLGLGLGEESGVWRLVVMMGAAGIGTGVLNAVLGRESVANVPPDRSAMGSGANNTARYLGAAIGITLFVTVATHSGDSVVAGWNVALAIAIAITLLGAASIALVGARLPEPTAEELRR
jgi:MFS family permease